MNMYEFHKNDTKQKNTDQTTSSKIDYDEYIEIIICKSHTLINRQKNLLKNLKLI